MKELVERILRGGRKRVVVLGDAMVDRWVHGRLAECQDGCQKFVQTEVVETPGGAANAERCIAALAQTSLCTYSRPYYPVKTRYVVDSQIVFRADDEVQPGRSALCQWSRDLALEMLEHADAVLLSDYDKGFLTPEFIRDVVGRCRRRGVPCVADCKRAPEVYAGCILKANGAWGVRHLANDAQSLRCSLRGVWESEYVETHGDEYPGVWDGAGWVSTILPDLPPVECRNHVGAGDCFAAHLMLALAHGFSLREAAALAHSAGRVYVQHAHNRPPTPQEVAADLASAECAAVSRSV